MEEVNSKLDTVLAFLLAQDGNDLNFDVIDEEVSVPTLNSGETQTFTVPFAKEAILQTVYIKTTETDQSFSVEIEDAPGGVVEYRSQGNLEYCYDVLDLLYINGQDAKELYLTITNDSGSPLNFELCRIRGLEI